MEPTQNLNLQFTLFLFHVDHFPSKNYSYAVNVTIHLNANKLSIINY